MSTTSSPQAPFKLNASEADWFYKWVSAHQSFLWHLFEVSFSNEEEREEAFLDTLEHTYQKTYLKRKKITHDDLMGVYLKFWQQESARQSTSEPFQHMKHFELVAWVALFRFSYSLDEVSKWLKMYPSKILFSMTQNLNHELKFSKCISEDCALVDLHLVEDFLKIPWKDSLGRFDKKAFQAHVSSCSRCQKLHSSLSKYLKETHSNTREAIRLPEILSKNEFLNSKKPHSWWSMPWFVSAPLSVVSIFLVIWVVSSIPYIGELYPKFKAQLGSADKKQNDQLVKNILEGSSLKKEVEPYMKDETLVAQVDSKEKKIDAKTLDFSKLKTQGSEVKPVTTTLTPQTTTTLQELAKKTPPSLAPVNSTPVASTSTAQSPSTSAATSSQVTVGDLNFFRWDARSQQYESDRLKILEILQKYSVERASDALELGASYSGGAYFHFYIAKSSFDSMMQEIDSLALLQLKKVKMNSPRRTKPGTHRVVFLLLP